MQALADRTFWVLCLEQHFPRSWRLRGALHRLAVPAAPRGTWSLGVRGTIPAARGTISAAHGSLSETPGAGSLQKARTKELMSSGMHPAPHGSLTGTHGVGSLPQKARRRRWTSKKPKRGLQRGGR